MAWMASYITVARSSLLCNVCLRNLFNVNKNKSGNTPLSIIHDDVIKWKHFPRCWPFVRGIHRWSVDSPHKGQWRGTLMFSLICASTKNWTNNREAGDLRRYRIQDDATVMIWSEV